LINKLEGDLIRQTKSQRDATRRKMIYIVACLSRLEARLMTAEGPLGTDGMKIDGKVVGDRKGR
jgi:hypothetical protein